MDILGIGYNSFSKIGLGYFGFESKRSITDSDIIVFGPREFILSDRRTKYAEHEGKRLYNYEESRSIIEHDEHWKREITTALNSGSTVFVFARHYKEFYIEKKNLRVGNSYYEKYNNFNFQPFGFSFTEASGNKFTPVSTHFAPFYDLFKPLTFGYQFYIDEISSFEPLLITKNSNKCIGGYYKHETGKLFILPYIEFGHSISGGKPVKKEYENLGEKFTEALVKIHRTFTLDAEGVFEGMPNWVNKETFRTNEEKAKIDLIEQKREQIEELKSEIGLEEESIKPLIKLKALLFANGLPLEEAVLMALDILGYKAEKENSQEINLDQVFKSPEGTRFIARCEGAEKRSIGIRMLRELADSVLKDFDQDEVKEEPSGLLFGNPHALQPKPLDADKSGHSFTQKAVDSAKTRKIGLIQTPELYQLCKLILDAGEEETKEKLKTEARDLIYQNLGSAISFSTILDQEKEN